MPRYHGYDWGGALLASGEYRDPATSLDQLIAFACPDVFQVRGLPEWAEFGRGESYAIDAKPPGGSKPPTTADVRAMMRDLLARRFGLRAHLETHEEPAYFLMVAKGGPRLLRPAAGDDRPVPPFFVFQWTRAVVVAHAVTMPEFAQALARQLHRPVIDRTGLRGRYSVNLPIEADTEPEHGGARPSTEQMLFQLLSGKLGLLLQAGEGTAQILVVDHVQHPSPN